MAFGLWIMSKGISDAVTAYQSGRWETTSGLITESALVKSSSKGGGSYIPQIQFEYSVGGQTYTSNQLIFGQGISGGNYAKRYIQKYQKGHEVSVSYNPVRPDQAVLERGITKLTFAPIVFGFVFFIMGFCMALLSWMLS